MDLFSIIWQFICLWGAIYTIVFIIKFYSKKSVPRRKIRTANNTDILPTHSVIEEQLEEGPTKDDDDDHGSDDNTKGDNDKAQDEWHIQLFQVRFTTQRLNSLFGRWARLCPTFWDWWFSIGVVVGGLTMIAGILVMVVAAFKILALFGQVLMSISSSPTNSSNPNNQLQRFVKRDVEPEQVDQQNDQLFLPMIPGVTLPLSHIGYYLSALLICGVIHEAGHAIASFTERVPIQSCGVFIYYIYPELGGWQSLEGNGGVSVVQVRSQSPMAPHLPVSSVIYQLDDTELEHNIADWNKFLLDPQGRENPHPGFCAMVNDNEQGDDESSSPAPPSTTLACCEIDDLHPFGKAPNASISCFRNFDTTTIEKTPDRLSCLPTIQVLGPRHPERCDNDSECSGQGMKCVTPYTPSPSSQVVRVYARMPDWMNLSEDQDKVFVFEGELVDIWESVKVGILQPKYWMLPASLPHRAELMLRYISSFTLALALLNILPAFKLDGDLASHQFLALVFQRSLNTTRNITGIHGILVKMITYLVGFVIIASIVLGTISSHV
ncbi:hypothetical protein BCR42DRAFT_414874 [Absidia repens]|uniref:Endopeptidase S2P n=1 Tax=Absidia repens TaxID=90262 RepID=A0A1X2IH41_9FUNG|nr:hypothetical protein BCR42DRAFT_414874 [Absidia repens]